MTGFVKFSPEELEKLGVKFPCPCPAVRLPIRRGKREPSTARKAELKLVQIGGIYGQQNLLILMALKR